jgi:DNA end-binding protein Ku
VTQVPNLPESVNVNDKELTMAKMLIDQLSTPFEPNKYRDDYREDLMNLINRKIAGEEIKIAPEMQPTNVIDLMAALQASLAQPKPMVEGTGRSEAAANVTANEETPAEEKKKRGRPKAKVTGT